MAAELEQLIVKREAAAEARDRRSRIRITVALAVVALIAVAAVALSAYASTASIRAENRRTQDVAATLAEPVAQRVLAEGRAESAKAARAQLDSANTRLIANRLPIVPQPAPDALSAVVQIQASRALLLADLGNVDFIAEGLRDRFGQQGAFPAAFLDGLPTSPPPDTGAAGPPADGIVEVLPGDDGPTVVMQPPAQSSGGTANSREPARPGTRPAPAPRAPGSAPAPAPRNPTPAPAPGPAQSNRDRGLCLLGILLCER